jgi:hypothetical protein
MDIVAIAVRVTDIVAIAVRVTDIVAIAARNNGTWTARALHQNLSDARPRALDNDQRMTNKLVCELYPTEISRQGLLCAMGRGSAEAKRLYHAAEIVSGQASTERGEG